MFQESTYVIYRDAISETREERVPGFRENAEMRFETVIGSPFAIPGPPPRRPEVRKDTLF